MRELRLALVCYGGVSLAIYMHGVTKEIHKLVRASEAFHRDHSNNPFPPGDTERVYWDLLSRMHKGEIGPKDRPCTRVVVDIISGTSAGGINGICLAKALAHNLSQDALKQLWIEKSDIGLLWRGPSWILWRARAAAFALRLIFPGVKPPLRSDSVYEWLVDAFEEMDKTPRRAGDPESLMPEGHALELFVPITDFHGYAREFPIGDPKVIRDTAHRHILEFRYRKGGASSASEDQFGSNYNNALAFAARATSSFPGAFPPMSLADAKRSGATVKVQPARGAQEEASPFPKLFSAYEVYGARHEESIFVDGGVLDNYPFQSSIRAIGMRSASCDVDRRLLFIEPDPTLQNAPPSWMGTIWGKIMKPDPHDLQPSSKKPEPPSWMGTIWATLSAIPRSEPVIDDLIKLTERNQNIARIRDIIETSFKGIEELVVEHLEETYPGCPDPLLETRSAKDVRILRREMEQKAREAAGFSAATYIRLRIRLLIDAYAVLVGHVLGYAPTSNQSAFLRGVFRSWSGADRRNQADAKGMLFERSPTPSQRQLEFLELFDLSYRERHVRFLIAAMSWWYRDIGKDGHPTRTELDAAKKLLYQHIAALEHIHEDLERLQDIDDAAAIKKALDLGLRKSDATPHAQKEKVDLFVKDHQSKLDALRDRLGEYIRRPLGELEAELYSNLMRIGKQWPEKVHGDLLVRYLGFPFWDMLVYPVQAVSNVGEHDHVEVMRISPMDARLLTPMDGGKLKGVTLAHFSAFLKREYRENDYLWGRLDATERLITLLVDDPDEPGMKPADPAECAKAFKAIVDAEQGALPTARDLIEHVRPQLEKMRRGGMVTDSTPSRPYY